MDPSPNMAQSVLYSLSSRNTTLGTFCQHQKCDASQLCPYVYSFPEIPILSLYFPSALILSPHLCFWLLFPMVTSALCASLCSLHKLATVLSPSTNLFLFPDEGCCLSCPPAPWTDLVCLGRALGKPPIIGGT